MISETRIRVIEEDVKKYGPTNRYFEKVVYELLAERKALVAVAAAAENVFYGRECDHCDGEIEEALCTCYDTIEYRDELKKALEKLGKVDAGRRNS